MSDVIMPQMGESIVEGTVTKWFKKVGDRVERDEPLFEISTDKVDTEVPSPASGIVTEILVPEGTTVQVNAVVARIGDGAGAAPPAEPQPEPAVAPPAQPEPAPAAEAPPVAPPAGAEAEAEEIRSSPLVRRLAKEHNIDLRLVKGTGLAGRITKHDVEAYLAAREAAPAPARPGPPPAPAPPAAPPPAPGPAPQAPSPLPAEAFPPSPGALFGRHTVEKLSVMRQRIGEHMVLTKRLAPHVSTVHQVDCTRIHRLRESVKVQFEKQNGVKLTFLPFFLRASCVALKAFPVVNASLDGTNIVYHQDINIGIAVALDWGLIVPVIKNADERNFLGLQRAVNDLAERARRKQLKPEEVQGGTFSISNYGSFGSLLATPAINQPQVAILGLGAIHKAPVVVEDAIAIRAIAYLTLTFDHRLLDGAIADRFLTHVRHVIEDWREEIL
jgi:pyruvate dehydrogenase E2 component (dihydrolipoamide acetyltransferase)